MLSLSFPEGGGPGGSHGVVGALHDELTGLPASFLVPNGSST